MNAEKWPKLQILKRPEIILLILLDTLKKEKH